MSVESQIRDQGVEQAVAVGIDKQKTVQHIKTQQTQHHRSFPPAIRPTDQPNDHRNNQGTSHTNHPQRISTSTTRKSCGGSIKKRRREVVTSEGEADECQHKYIELERRDEHHFLQREIQLPAPDLSPSLILIIHASPTHPNIINKLTFYHGLHPRQTHLPILSTGKVPKTSV